EFAIKTWHVWDWKDLQEDVQQRVYDDSQFSEHEYANYYSLLGDVEKANYFRTLSLERDPLSPIFHYAKVRDYIFQRKYNLALDALEQNLKQFPKAGFHYLKADILFYMGRYPEAYRAIEAAAEQEDANRYPHFYKGLRIACLTYMNQEATAQEEMKLLLKERETSFVDPLILVLPSWLLGDKEQALDFLELAYEKKSVLLSTALVSPYFDLIRNEDRFKAIFLQINFPNTVLG
ncbi:MAG: hypothetical protein AAFP02_13665, partial [Bacteroidota bacterium]